MGKSSSSISRWSTVPSPSVAPAVSVIAGRGENWNNFDNSDNAVSFGFVATAIFISMFLVMAIVERLFRARSTAAGGRNGPGLDAQMIVNGKLGYPSPKMTTYAKGVSVLMPGEKIPTFIAHLAPPPPPPPPALPLHQHCISSPISNSS